MSGEQTTFLAGAADATATTTAAPVAEQSTAAETTPPPQAATGQTVATPGTAPAAPADAAPVTSGQAEATKPAPVEVKVPKGVEWSKDYLDLVSTLPPEVGQKMLDLRHADEVAKEKEAEDAWKAQDGKWFEEIKLDPELGRGRLEETQMLYMKGINNHASKEFIERMVFLGLRNDPVFVKHFVGLGKKHAEDSIAGTTSANNGASKQDFKGKWFNAPGYEDLNP